MEKIKVLMVDDHRIVLEGISSLLARFNEVDIIAKTEGAEDAIAVIEEQKPDVLITDLSNARFSWKSTHQAGKYQIP